MGKTPIPDRVMMQNALAAKGLRVLGIGFRTSHAQRRID